MKKLPLVICYMLFLSAKAQDEKLTWGPELVKPRKTDISALVGTDKNSFYCLRSQRSMFKIRETAIEKYSITKLAPEYAKPITMPEINGKEMKFEKMFLVKGSLLLFASAYNSNLDKNIAYVQKMNPADGSKIGSPEEIDYIIADKRRNRGSFEFILSNDSSKILITHHEPYEKYSNEKFSYRLIDDNAKTLWRADLELPYKDKYFVISNYVVDNDGKVFMLASVKKEREDRERKKPAYTYDLITYFHPTKSLTEKQISLGDKFISDVSFALTSKGNIAIGGFYSNKNENGIAGTFFLSLDKNNNNVLAKGEKDLSAEFLSEFMSQRRAEKHKELYSYIIDYIVSKSNGGIYMVAEQYFVVIVTNYNRNGGSTTTRHYYYNDIIVVNINPDASIEWVKRIPKTHHSVEDYGYYSSYSFFTSKNKLHFIFNDHPKNLTSQKKKPRNGIHRKMVTVLASMDADGNLSKRALFAAREEKIYTRPKISMQISQNQSLFYAIKRKKYKFAIINY